MSEQQLQQLLDKQQIYNQLVRFCRTVDRLDRPDFEQLWCKDAQVAYHGAFEGGWQEFADWVWGMCQTMQSHSHQIANMLIEVDGEQASSEAYVSVTLLPPAGEDGSVSEIQLCGRYLDRWQKQQGEWKILQHELVSDIQSVYAPQTAESSEASARDHSDLSYRVLSA